MGTDVLRDERKPGWYIIDNEIIDVYGARMGPYGIAVYNVIARHAGKSGGAFPSYKTIADKAGIARSKAVKTVALLIELGLLTKTQRTDMAGDATSNQYTLVDIKSLPGVGVVASEDHLVPNKDYGSTPQIPGVVAHKDTKKTISKEDVVKGKMDADEPAAQPKEPAQLPPSTSFPQSKSGTGDKYMDVAANRAKQRQANGGAKIANRGSNWPELDKKVPVAIRLPLVERLIDMHGLRAAIDNAGDDAKLNDMHALAADLYVMGFTTLADIETVYEEFRKDWRGKTPGGRQLVTTASAMKQAPSNPTTTQAQKILSLKEWCLEKYACSIPQFTSVGEQVVNEQYRQYKQQQQQTH